MTSNNTNNPQESVAVIAVIVAVVTLMFTIRNSATESKDSQEKHKQSETNADRRSEGILASIEPIVESVQKIATQVPNVQFKNGGVAVALVVEGTIKGPWAMKKEKQHKGLDPLILVNRGNSIANNVRYSWTLRSLQTNNGREHIGIDAESVAEWYVREGDQSIAVGEEVVITKLPKLISELENLSLKTATGFFEIQFEDAESVEYSRVYDFIMEPWETDGIPAMQIHFTPK